MGFSKEFFEKFDEHIAGYRKHFWTGTVTVTFRIYEREFNVNRIVRCGDELLVFAYYDLAKQRKLPEKVQEDIGEISAFPVLTAPYESVLWVELNPGKAEGGRDDLGFRAEKK